MTHGTTGTEIPGTHTDDDADGVPDRSENDFARDGEAARQDDPTRTRRRPPADAREDDAGLESTREPRGDVVPPPSN